MLRSNSRNFLLSQLSADDLDCISGHLESIDLPRNFLIAPYDKPIDHYYFFEAGVGSMVAMTPDGKKVEAGLVGRDGVSPIAAMLGCDSAPFECMIQIAGYGQRIKAKALADILGTRPGVNALLLRFVQALFAQTAYTALSNAMHKVDQRLARWILMCHDRVEDKEFQLTHEFMAMMLGVRRSSVTDALHILEGEHLIRSARGLVVIRDRPGLERFAGEAYGTPEREYQKVVTFHSPMPTV